MKLSSKLTARNVGVVLAVLAFCVVVVSAALDVRRTHLARQYAARLRDPDPDVALAALDELRERGWVENGYLRDVSLSDANLPGADLSQANLRGTNFGRANLRGANLTDAQLHGALMGRVNLEGVSTVNDKQLAQPVSLLEATMPDGTRYDGRYRLPLDLDLAPREARKANDAERMAAFYGVSVEEYLEGQAWADDRLNRAYFSGDLEKEDRLHDAVEPGAVAVLASSVLSAVASALLLTGLPDEPPNTSRAESLVE